VTLTTKARKVTSTKIKIRKSIRSIHAVVIALARALLSRNLTVLLPQAGPKTIAEEMMAAVVKRVLEGAPVLMGTLEV
jgi:hypothetical protein